MNKMPITVLPLLALYSAGCNQSTPVAEAVPLKAKKAPQTAAQEATHPHARCVVDGGEHLYTNPKGVWPTVDTGEDKNECAGKTQSPVDISTTSAATCGADAGLRFFNTEALFKVQRTPYTIKFKLDDEKQNKKNYIEYRKTRYWVKQFHIHFPCEHHIDGRPCAMEIHIVHQSDAGVLAVVGIQVERHWRPNLGGRDISEYLDRESLPVREENYIPVKINLKNLLPHKRTFYSYKGSLTTPPCTEGVNWILFDNVVSMNAYLVNKLDSLVSDAIDTSPPDCKGYLRGIDRLISNARSPQRIAPEGVPDLCYN